MQRWGVDKKERIVTLFYSRGCKMDEEELGGKKFSRFEKV